VLRVTRLNAGERQVQFWDTYAGTVVSEERLLVEGGVLDVPFPTFARDMAVKIRAVEQGFDGLILD
jgi:hypothetical protein